MLPAEYSYYSDRLTTKERNEYLQLCSMNRLKIINDTLFNTAHDGFWKKVKERVDKEEGKME
jgi:hypothetical protein